MILNDENFEKELKGTDKFVLVDFFATWCEPCNMLAPILEKAAESFKKNLILVKVNIDDAPQTAQKFGIEKIPTVIVFKGEQPLSGFVGLSSQPVIEEWLKKTMADSASAKPAEAQEDKNAKIAELKKEYAEYADKNGFHLNPDEKAVDRVINGLLENEKKHGEKYCPCRRVTGNKENDKKIICPCVYHKDEIAKDGKCFCGLYVR